MHARAQPARERRDPRRPRGLLLDLELEEPLRRIDRRNRLREHEAPPAQERRTDDECRRAAASGIDHDVVDDAHAGAARAHDESVRVREPVLQDVAAPAEDVRPHMAPLPQLRGSETSAHEIPSVLARATASVLEPASSLRRIALTWW